MMQASWLGQSLSILQPSSMTGSGTTLKYIVLLCIKLIKIQNGFVYYYILGVQATP
jgi:hypothetical protein